jgi:hypothetical protein
MTTKLSIKIRKVISLYFDTLGALTLFVVLILVVWLSTNSLPISSAAKKAEDLREKTKEQRVLENNAFVVKYIKGDALTPANNPSTIAFGGGNDNVEDRVAYYSKFDFGFPFTSPRDDMISLIVEKDSSNSTDNIGEFIQKPIIKLGNTENKALSSKQTQLTTKQKVAITKDVSRIVWQVPDSVLMNRMPKPEPLLLQYGWLTGNIEMMLTIDEDGYVSNVVIYSVDDIEASLLRELKRMLLALHLGKVNANQTLPVSLSWNLP